MAVTLNDPELKFQIPVSVSENEATRHNQTEPGPAMGGTFYREDPQDISMVFKFCPDPSRPYRIDEHDWLAGLEVKCPDVPRLMREGFHWDASNVIKEEGYVEFNREYPEEAGITKLGRIWQWFFPVTVQESSRRIQGTRWYFLKDLNQPPRWAASVAVQAVDARILYNFDLSQLSRGLIRSVWASDQFQHQIYGYRFDLPTVRVNMIYDKMPMEGWWPWPRRENQGKAMNGVDKEMNENVISGNYGFLI
ncbi:hypothetical protein GGR55DRAFT_693348 [Xylaria sp. FL0064]|nr:hypothetical protein GGR55DRAFT_693348 [Xylaria sp. FL0064]